MKAHYKTSNGRMTFEVEGESPKALFKKIALVQEIFESDTECGCCKSVHIRLRSRQVDDFEFFELSCTECFARMQFGQNKKGGGLFPKRKDEDGNWLPNHGWSKYVKPGTEKINQEPEDARANRADLDDDVPFWP
jgi:hypothetical protein